MDDKDIVKDGACLDDLEDICSQEKSKKNVPLFCTAQQVADLIASGYNMDTAVKGGSIQLVEELDSDFDVDKMSCFEEDMDAYFEEHIEEAGDVDKEVDVEEHIDNHEEEAVGDEGDMGHPKDWCKPVLENDSEDETGAKKKDKNKSIVKVWDTIADLRQVELHVGSRFKNATIFRGVLKHYAAEHGFDYMYTKNESRRIGVICKKDNCHFRLWCSVVQGSTDLEIKTLQSEHNCEFVVDNERITSDFLAKRYLNYIRDNPDMKIELFKRIIHEDIGANVSEYRIYRAIKKAKTELQGDIGSQYGNLQEYCAMIRKSDPDSKVKVQVEHENKVGGGTTKRFLRMYMRFTAQKVGFVGGCRPFVGLDGCHLKGYFGGHVLYVVAYDANEQMFPLAFAIVEAEKKESWRWFLTEFFEDFGYNDDKHWVFISDKQKGLVELFKEWLPTVEHRYCIRHLYDNWYKQFKSKELKEMLWACAVATSKERFDKEMDKLEVLDKEAHTWLRQRSPESWCKAFFGERAKTSAQSNSLSECFNSWITKGRALQILDFCEFVRMKLMNLFYVRRTRFVNMNQLLCPKVQLMLEYNKKDARHCFALPSGDGLYQVSDKADIQCVNLMDRRCTCLDWQLSGIPCKHSMAAILLRKEKPEFYVSQYYHLTTYKLIYIGKIYPIPGMSDWPSVDLPKIEPPIIHKPPGRPRMRRKKSASEKVNPNRVSKLHSEMSCSICHNKGHNARTCTTKDYGETTSERKQRHDNNPHTTTKSGQGSKKKNKETMGEEIQKTRDRIRKKLMKKRVRPEIDEEEVNPSEPYALRQECTPEQIEAKRQAAMEKLAKKQNENDDARAEWKTGIYRTKKKKLQIMKKETKKTKALGSSSSKKQPNIDHIPQQQSTSIVPKEGVAQAELNRIRDHAWQFTQLSTGGAHNGKEKGKGRVEVGASRFSHEARFTRTAKGVGGDALRAANTQPQIMAATKKYLGTQSSSQP